MNPLRCLTIAGSDSGGGAGIQADLKTFAALGVYGTSAITAITAQNTLGVRSIHSVPVAMIRDQIDAVLEDIGTDAVKIGMLHNPEVVEVVAEALLRHACARVVLDPVMRATSGDALITGATKDLIVSRLFPHVSLITPNIPEAELLLGIEIDSQSGMQDAAHALIELGAKAVLLKGGHLLTAATIDDCLVYRLKDDLRNQWFPAPRIETVNTHGTGCTLSAAIAVGLAQGHELPEAVRLAKAYLSEALARGAKRTLGKGHGPIVH